MPKATNSTILSLVPKFTGASRITDYRPISCLNTIYKVISRLLVRRLKLILHGLIVPNQTAFVEGRLLLENTVLASELVNGYHKNKSSKKITLKVDIAKAFDTLSWDFLLSALESFNLPLPFLNLLKAWKRAPRVLQILHEFELRSGLAVSMQKSSFFSSGLSEHEITAIEVSTGMQNSSLPMRYLGVPMCTKKLNLLNCEPLLQQIKARLSSWSAKSLSFAGRLLLIKTVITGITTFWCSSFMLPTACIKRINSLCGIFLWHGTAEGHHSARVSWETVTLTKAQGGLGVKDLLSWNRACILKLIWLLFFRPDSVWVCWFKEVVLKGSLTNYWTVKPSVKYSWLANKLIKSRDLVYPLIKRRIGNGLTASFWHDNWSPFGNLTTFLAASTRRLGISKNATVGSLFSDDRWLLPPART
ncbi:uncharacterized protein LOC106421432 [Brassica napus]|uniref:uncharacterized protein LOC106421432 n=1 Tax=Brassica napus TaxID=3708 RepID=UPI0006AACDD2|nr:uncharacterized protein LOC106421432 [Brassica napus]